MRRCSIFAACVCCASSPAGFEPGVRYTSDDRRSSGAARIGDILGTG